MKRRALAQSFSFIDGCKQAGANFVGVGINVSAFTKALTGLAAQYRS